MVSPLPDQWSPYVWIVKVFADMLIIPQLTEKEKRFNAPEQSVRSFPDE